MFLPLMPAQDQIPNNLRYKQHFLKLVSKNPFCLFIGRSRSYQLLLDHIRLQAIALLFPEKTTYAIKNLKRSWPNWRMRLFSIVWNARANIQTKFFFYEYFHSLAGAPKWLHCFIPVLCWLKHKILLVVKLPNHHTLASRLSAN